MLIIPYRLKVQIPDRLSLEGEEELEQEKEKK